jgi:hypothetical protein
MDVEAGQGKMTHINTQVCRMTQSGLLHRLQLAKENTIAWRPFETQHIWKGIF